MNDSYDTLQRAADIRKMHYSDIDRIILVEREIFLFPWSPGNFADSIKAGYVCQVLEQDDTLTGYGIMMMSPEEAHILTLGIATYWQKKGLGKKLLQYFIEHAKKREAKSIFLDVRESNHGAAQLYKRMGFHQIATRKGYYPAMCGREDALVMQLEL
ncbi:ribosomal protein S18-alanine N-acetyltransferase [Nitrosomonas ureae]|uniref:[Ribosomal protein bS18]-alanine N-acetyltransferase n=1 Tax=Nitrosomonas ureae TaxID=44577 RepID=A0A0S3AG21_9PROT|nr:ribosomal protein S18-alanine N-acetyltransferase [Nitrosomonas ureae]ALQ50122.1 ribosomal-protein-alanine acetyltransferase [Nitrosomonas ureae]PTQ88835.1 [SSU ribosomal protein S18P]-alanine acetyltransferase [Nitrosomonas ureae]PXX13991.1 [SSU ribosomal protein S18P]-alanine acetyltransferase [Nitrosomonas ureae]SDT85424.1 [SSU ribosomal protein S18P]-alanine acetyltransferase [Nitrosomonas ureae]SEQ19567.1 ribosomal-protein-alanine N-acetyltransferase [Nitrosomonas ureae]